MLHLHVMFSPYRLSYKLGIKLKHKSTPNSKNAAFKLLNQNLLLINGETHHEHMIMTTIENSTEM